MTLIAYLMLGALIGIVINVEVLYERDGPRWSNYVDFWSNRTTDDNLVWLAVTLMWLPLAMAYIALRVWKTIDV